MTDASHAQDSPAAGKPGKPKKKGHRMGPVRDNLEGFGAAILAAVLLKWFCIEAYQIPTSSMQPTMMGCTEAGVYDRLLVDKIRYVLFEPQRWDITVFHYPLQKNQNYVKRCVGTGGEHGERLSIAGGNLYLVEMVDNKPVYHVLRKPEYVQRGLWKEIYPMRRLLRNETAGLGGSWAQSPRSAWSEDGDTFTVDLGDGRAARLTYRDEEDGGVVDRVWDGYSLAVGRKMREAHLSEGRKQEIVPDVKFAAALTPGGRLDDFAFEIEVLRPNLDRRAYAFEWSAGRARLTVRQAPAPAPPLLASEPFDCALEPGVTTDLAFARLDDELVCWCNGKELPRLDVAAFHTREGCTLAGPKATANHCVNAQLLLKGKGKLALRDLRLWRDQHYTRSTAPEFIDVPPHHYFMMGDNTLQSVDGRDWTAIKVGVLPDGTMVPPEEALKVPGGRVVRGNKRPVAPSQEPDRDETPVVFPSRQQVAMIDEFGEILALRTGVSPAYGNDNVLFQRLGSSDGLGDWKPPEEKVSFVPREHICGRALLGFWPFWPFSTENRLGVIR